MLLRAEERRSGSHPTIMLIRLPRLYPYNDDGVEQSSGVEKTAGLIEHPLF